MNNDRVTTMKDEGYIGYTTTTLPNATHLVIVVLHHLVILVGSDGASGDWASRGSECKQQFDLNIRYYNVSVTVIDVKSSA